MAETIKPNKNKNFLNVNVSLKDTEQFKILLSVFSQMVTDERIDKQLRIEYLSELMMNIGD